MTWTKTDQVDFILERTGVSLLDVEIDMMFMIVDPNQFRRYAGLELAVKEAKCWRTLIMTNFPSQHDIDTHLMPEKPVFVFNGLMNDLQSFKIMTICRDSIVFN
jgi:hypothetical protein